MIYKPILCVYILHKNPSSVYIYCIKPTPPFHCLPSTCMASMAAMIDQAKYSLRSLATR